MAFLLAPKPSTQVVPCLVLETFAHSGFVNKVKIYLILFSIVLIQTTAIAACGQARQTEAAQEVYLEMIKRGVERDVETYGALLVGLVQTGNWQQALELLDEVEKPSLLLYTLAIQSCSKYSSGATALTILNRAKEEGLKLNAEIYRSTMLVLGRAGMCPEALSIWEEWKGSDLEIRVCDCEFNLRS